MSRFIFIFVLVLVAILIIFRQPLSHWFCGSTSCCPGLTLNQQNAVGGFLSLSHDPMDPSIPPEVGPARIRAYKGDEIVWVFRNPSTQNVTMELSRVRNPGSTTDIKGQIFKTLGGQVNVAGDCGFGYLRAELRTDIRIGDREDTCAARVLYYDFLIRAEKDSVLLKCPYDPELVIEDQP
jgi:hypothetical protein